MIKQTKHQIDIDERKDTFCTEQNRVTRSDLEERFHGRISSASKLVAVLRAFSECKEEITDLDMIEVKVDGVNFPGC